MAARIRRTWNSPNRWILMTLIGLLILAIIVVLGIWIRVERASTPQAPGAFYSVPETLPEGPPGTIIKIEESTANLPDGAVAWRVMYKSTGLDGAPIAVTGTIVAPAERSGEPRPVIAWSHGTTGIFPECGISHSGDPYQQTPQIQQMIEDGYVVAITDYPGLSTPGVHHYMMGEVEAASVLDSVRVARQLDINAGDRFVVWGASQGGHAAFWTGQLAPTYAPELELIGVAASAPALNIRGIAEARVNDAGGGIFMGMLFYSWAHHRAELDLDDIIDPDYREQFERMIRPCFTAPLAFLRVGELLTPSQYLSVNILDTEPWPTLFDQESPRDPISVPILVAHGTSDPLIPMELSEAEFNRRCELGEDIQFARYPGSEHDAREDTAVMILGWVADRFAGRPTGSNCGT